MATIVLSALGTGIGGPIGGAIGAFIGSQIDQAAIRALTPTARREGPRVKDLAVTTSSYGAPLARHFGQVRAAGTIIWSTDLIEQKETSGGKNKPKTTTYSYSISFAVALASRPIARIGRIWADGNLLRGASGALKTGGQLRVYRGHGDQGPDPLIASAIGASCPAFRGLAYAVFEDLQLAEFGNRIPALTFEVFADDHSALGGDPPGLELGALLKSAAHGSEVKLSLSEALPLTGMRGYSYEGGALGDMLANISAVYPFRCYGENGALQLAARPRDAAAAPLLPEAASARGDDDFAPLTGKEIKRTASTAPVIAALRYYELARDYQTSLQRAVGRVSSGRQASFELPATLDAPAAKHLVQSAAQRQLARQTTLAWRTAELDAALRPGALVRVPGHGGVWRIESWEWRESGVELMLFYCGASEGLTGYSAVAAGAEPGAAANAPDLEPSPTLLQLLELPWDGSGSPDQRVVYAAAGGANANWHGAALYLEHSAGLDPIANASRESAAIGALLTPLPPSNALSFMAEAQCEVQFTSAGDAPRPSDLAGLAMGENRLMIGEEIVQYASCAPIGERRWRLTGLLRGRGGSEKFAQIGHAAGAPIAAINPKLTPIDTAEFGLREMQRMAAIGSADNEPVYAALRGRGNALRPLTPVHPRVNAASDGSITYAWTRRVRGGWHWLDEIELPLNEQREAYRVGLGPVGEPLRQWEVPAPRLTLSASEHSQLASDHGGEALWVRQIGSHSISDPLALTTL